MSDPAQFVRSIFRLCRFSGVVVQALCSYTSRRMRARRELTHAERAEWLQWTCRRALRAIGVRVEATGAAPTAGLVVANHLSYLDILAISSQQPMTFVSKSEVRGWPIFGALATMAGTVYINRNDRNDTPRASAEIVDVLGQNVPVVVFPEGTSSDGQTVLSFRRSLFETAISANAPITAAGVSYDAEGGCAATDVCYWGDMTLVPHLLKLFSLRSVTARLAFGEPAFYDDRRTAADTTRAQIINMRGCDASEPEFADIATEHEQPIHSSAL